MMIEIPTPGRYSLEEVKRRGETRYEELREQTETEHRNEYVAIDAETGDFEIADRRGQAMRALHARHPEGQAYIRKIGDEPDHGLAERIFGCSATDMSSREQVA